MKFGCLPISPDLGSCPLVGDLAWVPSLPLRTRPVSFLIEETSPSFTVLSPKSHILSPMCNNSRHLLHLFFVVLLFLAPSLVAQDAPHSTQLPNGKLLTNVPGNPRPTNNLPTAVALSPDGRFAVLLHSGFGSYTSGEKQSLSVLNLETDQLTDAPDDRLGIKARQTYFLGLACRLGGKQALP